MSGCEKKTDIEKKILGSWKAIEVIGTHKNYTTVYNETQIDLRATFYANNTAKVITDNHLEWTEYRIENDTKLIGSVFSYPTDSCNFTISEDGRYLTCIWKGYLDLFGVVVEGTVKYIRVE